MNRLDGAKGPRSLPDLGPTARGPPPVPPKVCVIRLSEGRDRGPGQAWGQGLGSQPFPSRVHRLRQPSQELHVLVHICALSAATGQAGRKRRPPALHRAEGAGRTPTPQPSSGIPWASLPSLLPAGAAAGLTAVRQPLTAQLAAPPDFLCPEPARAGLAPSGAEVEAALLSRRCRPPPPGRPPGSATAPRWGPSGERRLQTV